MLVLFIVGLCSVSGRVEFTSGVATHPRFGVHLRGCFFFYGVGFTTGGGNFPRHGVGFTSGGGNFSRFVVHLRGRFFFYFEWCSPPDVFLWLLGCISLQRLGIHCRWW